MSPEREIQQILARYIRAVDALDGIALSNLFTKDGKVEIYQFNGGVPQQIANASETSTKSSGKI